MDHEKLTFRFQSREFRRTDTGGRVVQPLLSDPADFDLPEGARKQSPNLTLLAETDRLTSVRPDWASGWLLTNPASLQDYHLELPNSPVVIADWNRQSDVLEHRKSCDVLQRQMTRFGDFAGYLV